MKATMNQVPGDTAPAINQEGAANKVGIEEKSTRCNAPLTDKSPAEQALSNHHGQGEGHMGERAKGSTQSTAGNTYGDQLLAEWSNYRLGGLHFGEKLYCNKSGGYYISGSGGPLSRYRKYEGDGRFLCGSAEFPVSTDEALAWLKAHPDAKMHEAILSTPLKVLFAVNRTNETIAPIVKWSFLSSEPSKSYSFTDCLELIDIANHFHSLGNDRLAFSYYFEAAKGDYPMAKYQVGYDLLHGIGAKRNMHEAFQYFSKAAEGNYFRGIIALAFCYMLGIGTDQDLCKARESFDLALKIMSESVQWNLMNHNFDDAEEHSYYCKFISFCMTSIGNMK